MIPLLIAVISFVISRDSSFKEFLVHVLAQLVCAGICAAVIYHQNVGDYEILNGTVTGKHSAHTSCEHSYSCHCRTVTSCSGSGKKRSCSSRTVCDTCYEHYWDVDWIVETTLHGIHIARVDRQGVLMPPRWASVAVGEPVSTSHYYQNYIKASPDTLFRHQGLIEKYQKILPQYPDKIYDYYRLDRLVTVGFSLPDAAQWNASLSGINAKLGASHQVNALIVIVKNQPEDFYYALEEHWIGGKKNDAVLVIGIDGNQTINWVHVMAWSQDPIFQIRLRDGIFDLKTLKQESVVALFSDMIVGYYHRKHMKDFDYLLGSITPTTTQLLISVLLGCLLSLGIAAALRRM